MQYTVEGLKALGYRGYIRHPNGTMEETDAALLRVAALANWNRYHLVWELDRKAKMKRIHVREGLFAPDCEIWVEKEMV